MIKTRLEPQPEFQSLKSITRIGEILKWTILLGIGAINRFPEVGYNASYCRCVGSDQLSNVQREGRGNT